MPPPHWPCQACPGPGMVERTRVQLPASTSPQAKPQTTSEDIQSHVQGELEIVTGQFPDLTAQSSCVNLPLGVKAQASTRNRACAAPRITPAPDADGPTECSTHLSFAAWNVWTRWHRGCEPRGEKQARAGLLEPHSWNLRRESFKRPGRWPSSSTPPSRPFQGQERRELGERRGKSLASQGSGQPWGPQGRSVL